MSSVQPDFRCRYCGSRTDQKAVIVGEDSVGESAFFCSSYCLKSSQALKEKRRMPHFEAVVLDTTRKGFLDWLDSYLYFNAPSRVRFGLHFKPIEFVSPTYLTYVTVQHLTFPDDQQCAPHPVLGIEISVKEPFRLIMRSFVKSWGWPCPFEKGKDTNVALLKAHMADLIKSAQEAFPTSRQKEEKTSVYVPKRGENLRQWRATWRVICDKVEQGVSISSIEAYVQTNHPDLPCSAKTLRKIIEAGEASLLSS